MNFDLLMQLRREQPHYTTDEVAQHFPILTTCSALCRLDRHTYRPPLDSRTVIQLNPADYATFYRALNLLRSPLSRLSPYNLEEFIQLGRHRTVPLSFEGVPVMEVSGIESPVLAYLVELPAAPAISDAEFDAIFPTTPRAGSLQAPVSDVLRALGHEGGPLITRHDARQALGIPEDCPVPVPVPVKRYEM